MAIGFDVSDRDGDKQLAAARHLLACGQRALTQQVEFVFVQAAFQAKQESIIALARGIDGLLIDEQSIDDAAHLDQLLQSRLLRAKRETSRAATAPTLPRQTSATIRSKPTRVTVPAAEHPRSSSTISTSDHPRARSRSCMAYCNARLSRLWATW